MTIRDFILRPRDGLFFNSARGWFSSASHRAESLDWPFPSTLHGVLRTACGRQEEKTRGQILSLVEWEKLTAHVVLRLCLPLRHSFGNRWEKNDLMWPRPADAIFLENEIQVRRLTPEKPLVPTLSMIDDAREHLWRPVVEEQAKPESASRWWTQVEFLNWLCGLSVKKPSAKENQARELSPRVETHVTIESAKQTAEDGQLFSMAVRETLVGAEQGLNEWAIYVRAEVGSSVPESIATLGGDRRLASLLTQELQIDILPQELGREFEKGVEGLRLVCVSPAHFHQGWLPDGFSSVTEKPEFTGTIPGVTSPVVLRAAFVPRPEHVSGWDMTANDGKGAPKPTMRLVAAGSVYFFVKENGSKFTKAEAESLWLAAWGNHNQQGFGRVVPGIWTPSQP